MTTQLVQSLMSVKTESTKAGKQTLLKQYENVPHFKRAIEYMLNPFEMVGISTKKLNKDIEPNITITDFDELLTYLNDNPTGSDAVISVVKGYLSQYEGDDLDILSQLIAKTLTIGVSDKSANKAYGDRFIPIFNVQLAFAYEKKIQMYTSEKFYVTQKLDGYRALTTVDIDRESNGINIETYSRKGQPIEGLSQLHTSIVNMIKHNPELLTEFPDGFALDGELLKTNTNNLSTAELFQATGKALRKTGETEDINYNVFDILPLTEFLYEETSTKTYKERREEWLDNIHNSEFVHIIPVLAIIDKDEIPEWSEYATNHEWEGVMLNVETGLYKKTRSAQLLKVKKMHTADLEIVGFNEAIDGKFKGGLKSIQVQLDDDNIVDVSSGLDDETRIDIWNNQSEYLGKMVEVQYFEETENEKGGKSLRFPVFKTMRYDKTPEDKNIE